MTPEEYPSINVNLPVSLSGTMISGHQCENTHMPMNVNSNKDISVCATYDSPNQIGAPSTKNTNDCAFIMQNNPTDALMNIQLKVKCWNIQGIGNKFSLEGIHNLFSKYDIIFLLETMKLNTFQPNLKDYTFYHCQRSYQHTRARRPSGGIAVLIKNTLTKCIKIEKMNECVIWLRISQNSKSPIMLGGTYIPPHGSKFYLHTNQGDIFNNLKQDLASFLQLTPLVALCGDFNSRTGNMNDFDRYRIGKDADVINNAHCYTTHDSEWFNTPRQNKDENYNNFGKELINLCKSSNMRIMNGFYNESTSEFTCYAPLGKSVVDYLICTERFFKLLKDFKINPKLVESDHTPLTFNVSVEKFTSHTYASAKETSQTVRQFYVFDKNYVPNYKEKLKNDASLEQLQSVNNCISDNASSDTVISGMYEYLLQCISPIFKKRSVKSCNNKFPVNPWFDDECKAARKTANNYAKQNNLGVAGNIYQYRSLHKRYKSTIQRKKRQFHKTNRDKLYSLQSQNQSTCWKVWNDLTTKSSKPNSQPDLETLQEYFEGQAHPPACDYFDEEHMSDIDDYIQQYDTRSIVVPDSQLLTEQICDSRITEDEVIIHMKKLKSNKASGLDGIPGEFFKFATEELSTQFCLIFNHILDNGDYPRQWSEGLINALHKKGDPSNPDNYRKITINVAMAKIFDSILNARLYFKNDAMAIDDPFQFGFTPNRRTTDCVFVLDTVIKYQQSMKKPIFLCFVDFSKAFDYVNRNALYYKLQRQGIGRKMLNVIISMFKKANAKIYHEGNFGDPIDSVCGVLQGGILSPKLFNEFMSDFPQHLNKTDGIKIDNMFFTHLLYADDIVLMSDSPNGLQNSLKCLHDFCSKWHLIVNITKTKVMQINTRTPLPVQFHYNKQDIENVDSYKYLGHVISNKKATHNKMSEYLCTQAQKALFALAGKTKAAIGYLPPTLALKMFDTYILPILEYNCMIWSKNNQNIELEKIQLAYLKVILGVRKQTSSLAVYAETGRFPLLIRQKVSTINYWSRLAMMPNYDILNKCFQIQKVLCQKGQQNFYSKVIDIFNKLEINEWEASQPDKIATSVKLKLYDNEQDRIIKEIHDSSLNPKLRSYKLFKHTYSLEPYLTLNLSKKTFNAISRFRTSSHNLRIETGRHETPKTPLQERLCLKCNNGEIEDEIHFLIKCSNNTIHRTKLFNKASINIPNFNELDTTDKFKAIMSNKTSDMIQALGNFLTETQ